LIGPQGDALGWILSAFQARPVEDQ